MKTASIIMALSLLFVGSAGALAFPAAASSESTHCSGNQFLKQPVDCAKWALECIGYALGGNGCVGAQASTGPDPKQVVDCAKQAIRNWLQGTPQPCPIGAAETQADPKEKVDCVKQAVRNFVQGTPQPCALGAAESQVDPKKVVDCTKHALVQIVNGNPVEPCEVSMAGPDLGNVVDCTKKAVRDLVQGTPQPCPV